MKKSIYILAVAAIIIVACKKENTTASTTNNQPATDQTKPVITLNGAVYDTISLGGTYTDPGTVATDDTDGDISAFVVSSGSVNTNVAGNYTKTYNVRDAAGNAADPKIRYIRIRNDADYLKGSYIATCQSSTVSSVLTNSTASYTFPLDITASEQVNSSITFSFFPAVLGLQSDFFASAWGPFNFYDYAPSGSVNSNSITVTAIVTGNMQGVISPAKTSFTLTTFRNITMSTTISNTIVAVKQ